MPARDRRGLLVPLFRALTSFISRRTSWESLLELRLVDISGDANLESGAGRLGSFLPCPLLDFLMTYPWSTGISRCASRWPKTILSGHKGFITIPPDRGETLFAPEPRDNSTASILRTGRPVPGHGVATRPGKSKEVMPPTGRCVLGS